MQEASGKAVLGDFDDAQFTYEGVSTRFYRCLLYTSDAADERSSVDLGGRRIIKKKKNIRDDLAYDMKLNKERK